MAIGMKIIALVSVVLTAGFALLYGGTHWAPALSLAITCGTVAYHFCMRLAAGGFFDRLLRNRVDYTRRWFRVSEREQRVYVRLGVKGWLHRMPTYDKTAFDRHLHSWEEIAMATCQAELVHEVIVVLSLLPILGGIPFGAWPVFILTSLGAALFDTLFVCMQRYNRPRILRLLEKRKEKRHDP